MEKLDQVAAAERMATALEEWRHWYSRSRVNKMPDTHPEAGLAQAYDEYQRAKKWRPLVDRAVNVLVEECERHGIAHDDATVKKLAEIIAEQMQVRYGKTVPRT